MTDLNKLRSEFEEALGKHNIHNVHLCTVFDFKRNEYFPSDVCAPSEDRIVDSINLSWKMWQEKAKAQAVPTWISVKDEEPPLDTSVLICWADAPDITPEQDYMTCDDDLNHIWANFYSDPPTHWMNFHKVPSESGAEG